MNIEKSRVQRVNQLHTEIMGDLRKTVDKAIEVGKMLEKVKADLSHGEWLPWIKDNLSFSQQTASNYVRLYNYRDKLPTVGNLSEAYRAVEDLREKERVKEERKRTMDGIDKTNLRERFIPDRSERILNVPVKPRMSREEGETVEKFLSRRKQILEDGLKEVKEHNERVQEKRKIEEIKRQEERFPGCKVTVTQKGYQFKCGICGKRKIEEYPRGDNGFPICESCRTQKALEKNFPDHRVKNHKVEFLCENCGELFWVYKWDLDTSPTRFCSEYCKYSSKLKKPLTWSKEEWEKIQQFDKEWEQTHKQRKTWWEDFGFNFTEEAENYDLGDPAEDANQEKLFEALVEYFDYFEGPNRKLHAIHNVVKKLRRIGNECQVEVSETMEEDAEIKQITAI